MHLEKQSRRRRASVYVRTSDWYEKSVANTAPMNPVLESLGGRPCRLDSIRVFAVESKSHGLLFLLRCAGLTALLSLFPQTRKTQGIIAMNAFDMENIEHGEYVSGLVQNCYGSMTLTMRSTVMAGVDADSSE